MFRLSTENIKNIYIKLVATDHGLTEEELEDRRFVHFLNIYSLRSERLISNLLVKEFVKLADGLDITIGGKKNLTLDRLNNEDKFLISLDLLIGALNSTSRFDYATLFKENLAWCNKATSKSLIRYMHDRYRRRYASGSKRVVRAQFKENILRDLFSGYAPNIFSLISGEELSREMIMQIEVEWNNLVKVHIKNYLRDKESFKTSVMSKKAVRSMVVYEPLQPYIESSSYHRDRLYVLNFFLNHRLASQRSILLDHDRYYNYGYLFVALDIYERNRLPLLGKHNLADLIEQIHKISITHHTSFNPDFMFFAARSFCAQISQTVKYTTINLLADIILQKKDTELAMEFLRSITIYNSTDYSQAIQVWSKRIGENMKEWFTLFIQELIYLDKISNLHLLYTRPGQQKPYEINLNRILAILTSAENIGQYREIYSNFRQIPEPNDLFVERISSIAVRMEGLADQLKAFAQIAAQNLAHNQQNIRVQNSLIDKRVINCIMTDYFIGTDEAKLADRFAALEKHIAVQSSISDLSFRLLKLSRTDAANATSFLLPDEFEEDSNSILYRYKSTASHNNLTDSLKELVTNTNYTIQEVKSSIPLYGNIENATKNDQVDLKRKGIESDADFAANLEKRAKAANLTPESIVKMRKFLLNTTTIGDSSSVGEDKPNSDASSATKFKLG